MKKTLLISGCSYSIIYDKITQELNELFGTDEVVNLSSIGASPDRQIRAVIEWTAQNGKPDMVMVPVSHHDRFDLPIATNMHPLHNLHHGCSWSNGAVPGELNVDDDLLKQYLKSGVLIHGPEHTIHDNLFVKLLTFQAYLQVNGIRHLIFDTGNYYEKFWMPFLSIDDENNSGYQPGMKKRELIENCPGIYKFTSFCSNVWQYKSLTTEQKKTYKDHDESPLPYPCDDFRRATCHYGKDEALKLMQYLKKEGAVYD